MRVKKLVKESIGAGFIFFILIGFSIPSVNAVITINNDDGIWSEDFKYNDQEAALENNTVDNCIIDESIGVVTLKPDVHPREYDFSEEDNDHLASAYQAFFFSPWNIFNAPERHLSPYFKGKSLDKIAELNGDMVTRSSSLIRRTVVFQFRFKLDVGADSIGPINISWNGETENADEVKLYYWSLGELGLLNSWKELNSSADTSIVFQDTIDAENASLSVMDDNYFYICVVAHNLNIFQNFNISTFLKKCTLSTDYIKITSLAEKAWDKGPGTITTNTTIAPEGDYYWEMLTWNDYQPDNTLIKCHILYDPGDGNFTPIPDDLEYFSGSNENGFSSSPVFLNKIPTTGDDAIKKIRIMANLSSDTASKTPKIYSWAITWQTIPGKWQDSFDTSYRIDSKEKINIVDGSINISSLQGEWPMFGFNTENTRATDGKGPQSDHSLKWYNDDGFLVGGEFINPVIGDSSLYIFSNSGKRLYKFDIKASKSNEPSDTYIFESGEEYVNSPALSEDYIIVASGKIGNGGKENYIKGINKDFEGEPWEFTYDEPICYYSSPVIYENKLIITSWGGDTKIIPDVTNNRVIALDLDETASGGSYDNDHEVMLWEYELPAGSYSTPAVYNDMVFVGCSKSTGDSFFVLDVNGNGDGTTDLLWSTAVGSVGRSSPVIHDGAVFVTSKSFGTMKVTSLNIENESQDRVRWEKTICWVPFLASADSTPAVNDGVLYVTSPRGLVYALNTDDGETIWSNNDYFNTDYVTSSPVYADGYLYVGIPSGKILALNTNENGTIEWEEETDELENFAHAKLYSSPIVSNDMLFIADEEGSLYAFGTYEDINREMRGSITSIPINLPTGYWWDTFSANYTTDTGGDIQFSILDENENHIKNISSGDPINLGSRSDLRSIRLHAELTATNMSVNPLLRWWNITYEIDEYAPDFVEDSFQPDPEGWLNDPLKTFSIDVWDNETGLSLSDALCTIKYDILGDSDLTKSFTPGYTGQNGTNFTTLTADISALDIAQNITNLTRLEFEIKDFADHKSTFPVNFKQDKTKPTSSISNETNGSKFTSEFVVINISEVTDPLGSEDESSGVASVQLKYRYSSLKVPNFSGDWKDFGEPITSEPFTWNFTGKVEGSHSKEGHYELITIATDNAENVEDEPESGDISFILDNEPPDEPDVSGEHYFNSLPEISIEFSDGFLLDTIKYRPEFETEWTLIDSGIDQATYDAEWDLNQDYWDQMSDGEEYVLYFWINDSLGNTQIIDDGGYKIVKDAAEPNVDLEIPSLETEWSLEDTFKITAFATDGDGSGIKTVELFYRYSEDGDFDDVNWSSYGILTSEPFEWEFTAEEGNGYYEFYVRAEDVAGNAAESEVFSTGINIFPIFSVIAMVILIIALILITIVIIIKWKKK